MPQIPQDLYQAMIDWDKNPEEYRQQELLTAISNYLNIDCSADSEVKAAQTENSLFAMFDKAVQTIKYPRLRFTCAASPTGKLVLHRMGKNSQYLDGVLATDGGEYGANQYWGRITRGKDSEFNEIAVYMPARGTPAEIKRLVEEIINNPQDATRLQGLTYKHCCFCGRGLQNDNSLTVGYGPICADKWGLPWEGTAEQARAAALTDGEEC